MPKPKHLFYCCLLTIIVLIAACTKWEFERTEFFKVITIGTVDIGANFAILVGDIANQKTATIVESGFIISSTANSETALQKDKPNTLSILVQEQDTLATNQAFAVNASGLDFGTTYFFRTYVQVEGIDEMIYGEIDEFTTSIPELSITSISKTDPGCQTTAEILIDPGELDLNASGAEVGLVWSNDLNNSFPTLENGNISLRTGNTNSLSLEVQCEQTYFVRAYVKTSSGAVLYTLVHAFTTVSGGLWQEKSSAPLGVRNGPISFAIDHQGYIGGGLSTNDFYSDLWIYTYETNSWVQIIADLDSLKVSHGSVAVHEGIAYILSGRKPPDYCETREECKNCNLCSCTFDPAPNFERTRSCECYSRILSFNPKDNSWKSAANSSQGLKATTMFKIGNKAFLGGGENTSTGSIFFINPDGSTTYLSYCGLYGSHTGRRISNSFQEFQFTSRNTQITTIGSLPFITTSPVSFSISGTGYLGMGYNDNPGFPNSPEIPLSDFYGFEKDQFSPNGVWRFKAEFPGGPTYGVGFNIGKKGYVLSGELSAPIELWQYDPLDGDLGKWEKISLIPGGAVFGKPQASFMIGNQAFIYFDRRPDNFWCYIAELE